MFCRKCGEALLDDSVFCSHCGEKVIVVNKKEVKSKTYLIEKDCDGNNGENEKRKKTYKISEVIAPEWDLEGLPKIQIDEPEKKELDEIKVNWNIFDRKTDKNNKADEIKLDEMDNAESFLNHQDKEKSFLENSKVEEEIDKQEAEYKGYLSEIEAGIEKENQKNKDLEKKLEEIDPSEPPKSYAEKQIDKFYTFNKQNEEFQKLLDREYEKMKKQNSIADENVVEKKEKTVEIKETIILSPAELEKKLQEIKLFDSSNETKVINKRDIEIEEKETLIDEKEFELFEDDNVLAENKVEEDLNSEKQQDRNDIKQEKEKAEDNKIEEEDPIEEILPHEEEIEKESTRISIVNVLIVIISIAVVLEGTILGVKYFFPDSSVAKIIDKDLKAVERYINSWFKDDNQDKNVEDESKQGEAKEDNLKIQGPLPTDPQEMMKELIAVNRNIQNISFNDELKYDENKSYEDANIQNSVVIDTDIYREYEDGRKTYLKPELAKLLVEFDSSWFDYGSKGDLKVFEYMKTESPIYLQSKSFSKAGQVTELFDSLEIGEMRKTEKGFYIWAKETIKVPEATGEIIKTENCIYYVEKDDQEELKLVKYMKI